MLAHMKKHHIEIKVNHQKFLLKTEMIPALLLYLKALSMAAHEWISPEELRKDFLDNSPRYAINLKAARNRANLSQIVLAKKTGIDRSNLIAYEKGRKKIGRKVANKIAAILKIDPLLLV